MTLQEKKHGLNRALATETAALDPMNERVRAARKVIDDRTQRQAELRDELKMVDQQLGAARNEYESAWGAASAQQRRISLAHGEVMQVATPKVN